MDFFFFNHLRQHEPPMVMGAENHKDRGFRLCKTRWVGHDPGKDLENRNANRLLLQKGGGHSQTVQENRHRG